MSTTVTYKGVTITTAENQTRTLATSGKWLEADIVITDVTQGSGGMTVTDVQNATGTGSVISGDASVLTTKSITQNGTYNASSDNVDGYSQVVVNVPTPSAFVPNVQIAQGVNRVNTTSYSAVSGQSITVSTTGTYEVYWTGYRSSTSGTSGSCLYVNDAAHSSGNQTTFSNHGQSIKLTGVALTKNDVLTVRAVARGTQYYMYVGNLTIVQTA